MKPRLLDLFCGAGGAGMGYHRAGFEVVGVDINPQPNYPFEFKQADALEVLRVLIEGQNMDGRWDDPSYPYLRDFDVIHASPPCQAYTALRSRHQDKEYPELIAPVRELLNETRLPYVIENVEQAKSHLIDPVMICGSMFDPVMEVRRHRYFEANWPLQHPTWPCRHKLSEPRFKVYEHGDWNLYRFVPVYGHGGGKERELGPHAMGIDWMTRSELVEAIPPAYCEFVGQQLMTHLLASGRVPDDSSPAHTRGTVASPGRKTDSPQSTDGPADNESYARSHPEVSGVSEASFRLSEQDRDERDSRNAA